MKCGKCGVSFDKTTNPKRRNDYYSTCQLCRDKINGIVPYKRKVSVNPKPEPEQPDWKAVVFGKSNSKPVEPDLSETDSVESEKPFTEDESDPDSETPIKSEVDEPDTDPVNEPIIFRADDVDHMPISTTDLQNEIESKHRLTKPSFFDISDNGKE